MHLVWTKRDKINVLNIMMMMKLHFEFSFIGKLEVSDNHPSRTVACYRFKNQGNWCFQRTKRSTIHREQSYI